MASPGALVVFKILAARPRDIEDAEALLLLHEGIDIERVRRHVLELAELAGDESLAAELERIVERSSAARETSIQPTLAKRRSSHQRSARKRAPKKRR